MESINDYINQGHYLAFVDIMGKTVDGRYIYRVDFTQAPDIVWGNLWNATPAGIIPQIRPEENCLSITAQLLTKHRYQLAKENTCFSMQDCIDGILPLMFDEPYSDEIVVLPFGLPLEDVIDELEEKGLHLENVKVVSQEKDDAVIDNLIDNLESQTNNQDGQDDDEGPDDEDFDF